MSSMRSEAEMIDSTLKGQFELRFPSLFISGRGFAFLCDPAGQINLGALSECARNNYLYARAMVGRELAVPAVRCSAMHGKHSRLVDLLPAANASA